MTLRARDQRARRSPAGARSEERRLTPARHAGGGRPRLRRPVLAADRPPRARLRRVLRAAAAPRRRWRRSRGATRAASILSGGPASVYADGRAAARARAARARACRCSASVTACSCSSHALGGTRRAGRGRRVRALGADGREPGVLLARPAARADLLDVAPRHGVRAAARASPRWRPRPARRSPRSRTPARGIYGIQFHPEVVHTPYGQEILTRFLTEVCGCERDLGGGVDRRGADRADPRAGRRRAA